MALYLTEADVRSLLTVEMAIDCLEEGFRSQAAGNAVNLPRRRIALGRGSYNVMSAAWLEKGVVGQKSYVATRGGVGFHVLLYSATGDGLLAMIEASALGQIRTGAASGLASRYMARADSATVGMIGAGYQAQTQLEAVARALPITAARVYSRSSERREKFAAQSANRLGIEMAAAATADEAVEGADVVIAITGASQPVLLGEWLQPGVHINAAGGNGWLRRELDSAAVEKAGVIATDDLAQAQIECADLMHTVETGGLRWEQVFSLADVVSGRVAGRTSPEDVTLFESQGVALEDVAVAERLYRMAGERGVGSELPG